MKTTLDKVVTPAEFPREAFLRKQLQEKTREINRLHNGLESRAEFARQYHPAPTPPKPFFSECANATLERVRATYAERSEQYADTWRNCQWLTMKSVARALNCSVTESAFRALAAAAFVDMKYARAEGGWKDDTMIDGIAYQALLAEEMRRLLDAQKPL